MSYFHHIYILVLHPLLLLWFNGARLRISGTHLDQLTNIHIIVVDGNVHYFDC